MYYTLQTDIYVLTNLDTFKFLLIKFCNNDTKFVLKKLYDYY